ncbi:MAG: DNA polymerase III subunit delta' [Alphaproteobacteria bacterium]|uniref:DNA polymerase III subunit delta n=1 Tax=Candidatus Nitrobium versatile TaxID=2884831 RepID=A0A953JCW8_9BACT|nr:DNA polymerase III subunit delta' [Candidatus Nitrobium versatile]
MALREIIGQERALRILFGTLRRNRVPSAVLLSGDTGIGKMRTAVNYAKAVNCLSPVEDDCCDHCPSCRKTDAGVHPDVILLLPEEGEIKIDAIRRLEEVLSLRPFEGRRKVVIIDDADAMNLNAANAFLKTLEEPPSDSLILLIASNPDGLPDTIRSRCITIRLYPLSGEGCRKVLSGAVEDGALDAVLKLSMGRPGIALSRDLAGEREWFLKLLRSMEQGDAREVWEDKNAMKSWLDLATLFLRDRVVFAVTGNESDLLYGADPGRHIRGASRNAGGGEGSSAGEQPDRVLGAAFEAYRELLSLRSLLDFNLNKSISWNYVAQIMRSLMVHSY